jgi:O-antigen/teichoic acid export membrane protein
LVIVIYFNKSLIYYAYLSSITILLLNIFKSLYLKIIISQHSKNSINFIEKSDLDTSYKVIMLTGYRCMLGALASMFVLNTDNIVIAKYIGIEYVTEFSVTFKIYTTVFSLIYLFNSSIVPLVGKNIFDKNYIKKTYNNTLLTVIIFGGLFWVGTVAFGKTLIYLWVGKNGYAGVLVLVFLGAYSYIFSIVNLNYIMINTLNHLKGIVFITWLEGILNLIFSIYLGKLFGLAGIAAGTFLGTFLSPFFFFSIILKKRTENLIFQNNIFILKHFLFSIIPSIIAAYFINQSQSKLVIIILYTVLLSITYIILSYLCLPTKYKSIVKIFAKEIKIKVLKNKYSI